MSFERTPYDYEMLRNYNQQGPFHAQPWPTPRSKTDLRLQHEWCPNCNKGNVVEGFAPDSFHAAPWPTPRSKTDLRLQHEWCPTCEHPIPTPPRPPLPSPPHPRPHPHIIPGPYGGGATPPVREHYDGVIQTPRGNVRNPYQACGNTHSSGPVSTPSTWEPMQMPMGANPNMLVKGKCYCKKTDEFGITKCDPQSSCNETSVCPDGQNCGVYDPDNSPYCGFVCPNKTNYN